MGGGGGDFEKKNSCMRMSEEKICKQHEKNFLKKLLPCCKKGKKNFTKRFTKSLQNWNHSFLAPF